MSDSHLTSDEASTMKHRSPCSLWRTAFVLSSLSALLALSPASCRPKPVRIGTPHGTQVQPSSAGEPSSITSRPPLELDVDETMRALLAQEDTDGDRKITIEDRAMGAGRGNRRFWVTDIKGRRYEVRGTYYLSNLLQELKLAQENAAQKGNIDPQRVFENPVERLSRTIRERFWDGLTRRVDGEQIGRMLGDQKTSSGHQHYLYVPYSDQVAHDYFSELARRRPALKLQVVRLPQQITPDYVRSLDGKHGLLSLALERGPAGKLVGVPFVVPGGRYNEMYGWDSYFEALGLLEDGRLDLAKAMVDNFVYQINHYGKILNANRTYYLTRSQPPFLSSMALAVYARLPHGDTATDWLATVTRAAIKEYRQVWTNAAHETPIGLSRYFGSGKGAPPEVEPGHFDTIYAPYAARAGLSVRAFEKKYRAGGLVVPQLDKFLIHDRCVRESGHDTTYRWQRDGDRCADFATVDLNALLYKTELDIGRIIARELGGTLDLGDGSHEKGENWYARARRRKALIMRYLWDDQRGLFFDYDTAKGSRYPFVSATTLYPLWAWHTDEPSSALLTAEQARRLVAQALQRLEMPGGVAGSDEASRGPIGQSRPLRQWDYPHGWPPHQMLIWRGLINHGMHATAQRLIYRWLYTITRNAADYNGTVPEKFDVVARSHHVFAEYGNVGTKFSYITTEGFGWMNASFQVGLALLSPPLRAKLARLVPPEWVFAQ